MKPRDYIFTKINNSNTVYNLRHLAQFFKNEDGSAPNLNDLKQRSELIRRIKKALINMGAYGTVLVSLTNISGAADYVIQRSNRFVYADISAIVTEQKSSNLAQLFAQYLHKNPNLTDKEKAKIVELYTPFLNDWGRLFSEDDIIQLLVTAQNTKKKIGNILGDWAVGDYNSITNEISLEENSMGVLFHEVIHALSDHGITAGTSNPLGYSLNEGITESIAAYYSDYPVTYYYPRKYAILMSKLVGKEVLLKGYVSNNINYIIDYCCSLSKDVSRKDVIMLIAMMDMDLYIYEYHIIDWLSLPTNFDDCFYKLYDKIFTAIYQKSYRDDLLTSLIIDNQLSPQSNGILSSEYHFNINNVEYKVPNIESEEITSDNLNQYIEYDYYYKFFGELLLMLLDEGDFNNNYCKDFKALSYHISEKYFNSYEEFNKYFIKLCTNPDLNSINQYLKMYFQSRNNCHDPRIVAADIRYDIDLFIQILICSNANLGLITGNKDNELETGNKTNIEIIYKIVNNAIDSYLSQSINAETYYYYYNSDFSWYNKDLLKPEVNKINQEYRIFFKIDSNVIKGNPGWFLIFEVPENYDLYSLSCKNKITNKEIDTFYTTLSDDYYQLKLYNQQKPVGIKSYVILASNDKLNIDDYISEIIISKTETYDAPENKITPKK